MRSTESQTEGIYNSDVFNVLFDYEITRARRYPSPVSLIQIEVKPITSNVEALQAAPEIFMTTLSHQLRSVDIPSRMGDVFRIMLPTTNEAGARAVCERLISVFKNKFDTPAGYSIAYSLQIGATSHGGGSALSGEELFQKIEEALRQSRAKGPNTYVIMAS